MLMSRNTPTGLPAAASCRKFQVWLYHQHNKRNRPGPTCHSQSKIEIRTSTFKAQISNFLFLIFLFRDYNLSFRKCSGISKISRSIPEFHCQVTMIDGCNNSLSIIRRKNHGPFSKIDKPCITTVGFLCPVGNNLVRRFRLFLFRYPVSPAFPLRQNFPFFPFPFGKSTLLQLCRQPPGDT